MTKRVGLLSLALVVMGACYANAGVTSVSAVQVDKGGVLPTRVTNDIKVDFTGFIRGQQMIVNLTTPATGGVFQRTIVGSNFPPDEEAFVDFPDAPYDTFIAMGGLTQQSSPDLIVVGGAVDLVPGSALQFNTNGLNVAWAPGTGVDIGDSSGFTTARVSLSNTAMGTIQYFGSTSAGTGAPLVRQGTITNGVISFGQLNTPPVVDDKAVEYFTVHPSTIVSETLNLTDNDPAGGTWSLVSFAGRNGKLPGAGVPSVNPATGLFTWLGNGSQEGVYDAVIQFTDAGGLSDSGNLAITWHIPEPSCFALLGLALVGFAGFRRK